MQKIIILSLTSFMLFGCVSMKTYRSTKSELLSLKYGHDSALAELEATKLKNSQLEQDYESILRQLENTNDDTRIAELEAMLAERDQILDRIKAELVDAVGHLQGKGLTLTNKNGKIYVLMEDKLLFESGKYDLTSEGEKAIRDISEVLVKITNVDILIEGHTDNRGLLKREGAQIIDNWDLSCKRATEVVRVMNHTKGLKPVRITASGRGQYLPVATNDSDAGRAQNRRTEIILTPKLDKLMNLLK